MNVLGTELLACSFDPLTGYFRDGCCNTQADDLGSHVICAKVTQEFLEFSKQRGNDLSTPMPHYRFPGLKPGDKWCLCALRWHEAFKAGKAPKVMLKSTNIKTIKLVPLEDLMQHAIDVKAEEKKEEL